MYKIDKPYIWKPGLLFLHMGYSPECVLSSTAAFANSYKPDWFKDDYNVRCVESIDKMSMIVTGVFHSDFWGNVSYDKISGGAKALITANMTDRYIQPLSNLGDNCVELLYELTRKKEVHFYYQSYLPKFLPEQEILDISTGLVFNGREAWDWERFHAPLQE